jgi:hypothetical protein
VPIKASSSRQIQQLVADLDAGDVRREAAVARLIVIGARAVERVIAVVGSTAAPAAARAAALRALESIGDRRAVDSVVSAIGDPDAGVAAAAVSAATAFMRGPRGAAVVDAVTAVSLDAARPPAVRLAAIRAMRDLEPNTVAPLMTALASDPDAAIRAAVPPTSSAKRRRKPADASDTPSADQRIVRAAEDVLPDDPRELRELLLAGGESAPLPILLRIVERVREREGAEPASRAREWAGARAAAHVALANRNSRLALYDLRESLERAAAPLPVEFLAALEIIGDASCLESIAAACARTGTARKGEHDWWRDHLARAFQLIAKREKITRRHAVMKKIEKRWPAASETLWAAR